VPTRPTPASTNTFRRSLAGSRIFAARCEIWCHAADPDVTETIKRTKQPYFTLHGNICALLGAKDHLNIFIYDPIVPDPEGIINQGQGT